jgi:serine/threonine protein kinase
MPDRPHDPDATLDTPHTGGVDTSAPTAGDVLRERAGQKIGAYKLLQQLGEGGFGSVFLAEQEQPVRRQVALKIIKLGMDTRQVVARFEQERQALAIMDHPGIARCWTRARPRPAGRTS